MHVIVCGAGINGVSCALWLARKGVQVTLVDRAGPASGTSYGNAGVLASGSVIPVTVPGLLKKAPGMLMDSTSPLFMRWRYFPRLAPFLRKYMGHANIEHVRRYARAMTSLLSDSVAQHQALAKGTAAEPFISFEDYCFAYQTRAAFDAENWAWRIRQENGLPHKVVSGAEFAAQDPLYTDSFDTVVRSQNHGRISDPGAYIKTLCDEFLSLGGELKIATVTGLHMQGTKLTALQTSQGDISGDSFAFTLGPWAGDISRKLGLNVPFESEGGYHIELINPSDMPNNPVMVASGKFVVTPMRGRLRLAGVVDFSGLDGPDNQAALDLLERNVTELFPSLSYDRMDRWHGYRPTTANSLPLIGRIKKHPNAFVGFGHQHVGLTGGAKTGRLLSALVIEEPTEIDTSPFDPNVYA